MHYSAIAFTSSSLLLSMKLEDFAAGVNRLCPLLNPAKHGQYQPKELTQYLQKITPFLNKILKFSHEDKAHPAASFACNLLYTCETIVNELAAKLQDPSFDSWELQMNERSECTKIEEDTPLPAIFLSSLSNPKSRKCPASPVDDSGNMDASGDDDDEVLDNTGSGDNGSDDESEEESDESEEERTSGKGVPKLKAPLPGKAASTSGTTSQAKGAIKNEKKKASLPKAKFTTPKEPEVGLSITVPVGPPKKAPKTQPGSIKDEPVPTASSSHGSRASQHPKGKGEEKPVASSSKAAAPATVTIKHKKHPAFSTHQYGREIPVPVKDEEIETIVQASTMPQYGCTQCSSSIQNQPCVFLGWGKHCNNCEAATKSLCSYRAEPIQCYHARKELAKFVEVMPDNVCTSIAQTSTALQVFKTCTNAAAQAAQQYQASLEETLAICQDTATNKGRNALRGIIFESLDFKEQLCVALIKVDRSSSISLGTGATHSFQATMAQAFSCSPLRSKLPSCPLIEDSSTITTLAPPRATSTVPKDDLGDEVNALMDQIMSSLVHPPIESLKDA
ncbi:hypothetical protein EV421DRAFT_1911278 [Armillaria borealis]|uniref:Uncharacterized protein n=1 Tax=Armillaria borealis TaxID=47425 RepID=A0AA39IX34_9AGAR|nr:hypothetical protein EV421DRAFT_1911278 [Armillaria borealis]